MFLSSIPTSVSNGRTRAGAPRRRVSRNWKLALKLNMSQISPGTAGTCSPGCEADPLFP